MTSSSDTTAATWDAQRRAEHLHSRRGELLARLPRVIADARRITLDERELIVDEAIEFTALRYDQPVHDADHLERTFWDASRRRVLRALEGRQWTVRRGNELVSDDTLADVADSTAAAAPDARAEQTAERDLAADFAATLSPPEAEVLRMKYLSDTRDPIGYRKVAQLLEIPAARARALERSIGRKIDDFAAVVAAGELCGRRAALLSADAAGAATELQHRVARAHLRHCAACRTSYKAELRALRTAEFGRQVASVLPIAPAAAGDRHGRVRELLADWAGRLIGHDPSGTATQLASGGAGRGAGSVIAVKIAACLAGGAATIGVCVATGVVDLPATGPSTPSPTPTPAATSTSAPTRTPKPRQRPTPTPKPKPKPKPKRSTKRSGAGKTQGGTSPSSHEKAPASPAPAGSLPNGGSEFNPDAANLPRAPAAPVPAAPGAREFGP